MLIEKLMKSNFWEAVKEGNLSKVEEYVTIHHVDVNMKDLLNNTPLHYAVLNQDISLMRFLIKNGADINAKNESGKTALHTVLEKNSKGLVEMLLRNGANVNLRKCSGERPLDIAIDIRNTEFVKFLLNNGAMINYSTNDISPLHRATLSENKDIIKILIEYGADINSKNKDGKTVLDIARQLKNTEIINIFEEVDYWDAVKEGNIEKIGHYLKSGNINVNTKDILKNTPLHYAILNQDIPLIEFLIQNGADVNVRNRYGKTVLHTALERKSIHLIEILLRNGANVNLGKFSGERPLDIAVEMKNKDVVKILLDNGALVNHTSEYNSALHRAVTAGSMEIAEMLLEHGAKPMLENKSGKTPLSLAKKSNSRDVFNLLLKYVLPRIAIQNEDTETLRESLREYTANHERDMYTRMNQCFKIDHYMYLLKQSEQVIDLVNSNKAILKELEHNKKVLYNIEAQRSDNPELQLTKLQLKNKEKNLKSDLNKNKGILKIINETQKDVDALLDAQIVNFILARK